MRAGKIIHAHKPDIFLFENDGKAGGFLYKCGTVIILPASGITQYAHQRGRLTEATLHDLVQKIERSLNQKEFALGVFLDIDGAFDNASYGSMDAASMRLF
jgi:hypothetical protein